MFTNFVGFQGILALFLGKNKNSKSMSSVWREAKARFALFWLP
jgi:hypothetical protein